MGIVVAVLGLAAVGAYAWLVHQSAFLVVNETEGVLTNIEVIAWDGTRRTIDRLEPRQDIRVPLLIGEGWDVAYSDADGRWFAGGAVYVDAWGPTPVNIKSDRRVNTDAARRVR
jgi:hypothetical protein